MENHSSSEIETSSTEVSKRGLTRRQVAVGAAWAAPVVALAVATPFAAASNITPGNPATYPRATQSITSQDPSNPPIGQSFGTIFNAKKIAGTQSAYKVGMTLVAVTRNVLSDVTPSSFLTLVGSGPISSGGVYTWTWTVNTATTEVDVYATPSTLDSIAYTLKDGSTSVGSATAFPQSA